VTSTIPCGAWIARSKPRTPSRQQVADAQALAALAQQAQHDRLAELRGHRRHADVEARVARLHGDAAVLRQAPLGDVELRHQLEPHDQRRGDARIRLDLDVQDPVDAKAHDQRMLLRLEVDVGRVDPGGIVEDRLQQLDDRRVGIADRAAHRREVDHVVLLPDLALDFAGEGADLLGLAVDAVDGRLKLLVRDRRQVDMAPEQRAQLVLRAQVGRVDHADQIGVTAVFEHHRAEPARLQLAEPAHDVGVHVEAAQVDERQVQLTRDGLRDLLLAGHAGLDQQLAEQLAGAFLLGQGLVQLLGPQQTLLDQHRAQGLGFLDGQHRVLFRRLQFAGRHALLWKSADDLDPTVETRGSHLGTGSGVLSTTFEAHEAAGPFVEIGRDSNQRKVCSCLGRQGGRCPRTRSRPVERRRRRGADGKGGGLKIPTRRLTASPLCPAAMTTVPDLTVTRVAGVVTAGWLEVDGRYRVVPGVPA
jgi:hypothetical protein